MVTRAIQKYKTAKAPQQSTKTPAGNERTNQISRKSDYNTSPVEVQFFRNNFFFFVVFFRELCFTEKLEFASASPARGVAPLAQLRGPIARFGTDREFLATNPPLPSEGPKKRACNCTSGLEVTIIVPMAAITPLIAPQAT